MFENALAATDVVLQAEEAAGAGQWLDAEAAAAIAVGLSALAAGYAERGIGAAAVGAIAEDDEMFVPGIVMTVLPETLVIFAIVAIFLVQ